MSNILNHNNLVFRLRINREDYWDFHLATDSQMFANMETPRDIKECLATDIDFSNNECVWFDDIFSKSSATWKDGNVTKGFSFDNYGYTAIDNGSIPFRKDLITNKDFLKMFTNTTLSFDENDKRLKLHKVGGAHNLYDYTARIIPSDEHEQVLELNGGWYQGFFASSGGEYKVLPMSIEKGWTLHFSLNKTDLENDGYTLNKKHTDNKGIFFYLGTRSENKWWTRFLTNHDFKYCNLNELDSEYVPSEYASNDSTNSDYFGEILNTFASDYSDGYFSDGYVSDDYNVTYEGDDQPYLTSDYYEQEVEIDNKMYLRTSTGYNMYQPNIKEIKTDNKFLLFDRTKNGSTVYDFDENAEYIVSYVEKPNIGNYFLLFNRTKNGYDVCSIKEVIEEKNKAYNVLNDLYSNAIAFQIKDNGSVGYKYLVRPDRCKEGVDEEYKIIEGFSKEGIIKDGQWHNIDVKMYIRRKNVNALKCPTKTMVKNKMILEFYVDGILVYVSKELEPLNLRPLNDLHEKQEGVPYNISIGGGTQGLAETIYVNYMRYPDYILPLEKEFAGSFIGYMKDFKFFTCPLTSDEIRGLSKK